WRQRHREGDLPIAWGNVLYGTRDVTDHNRLAGRNVSALVHALGRRAHARRGEECLHRSVAESGGLPADRQPRGEGLRNVEAPNEVRALGPRGHRQSRYPQHRKEEQQNSPHWNPPLRSPPRYGAGCSPSWDADCGVTRGPPPISVTSVRPMPRRVNAVHPLRLSSHERWSHPPLPDTRTGLPIRARPPRTERAYRTSPRREPPSVPYGHICARESTYCTPVLCSGRLLAAASFCAAKGEHDQPGTGNGHSQNRAFQGP